jgi:hypothetical protein
LVADDAPRGGTVAALLAAAVPGRWAWTAAAVALVGVGVPLARRARRPPLAALAVGVAGLVLHLLVAWVTLPAFNAFASARPVGEALGRVARAGTPVVAYGFDNRERLSALLFYAGHGIVEVRTRKRLAHLLVGRRACAVVAAGARARLPAALQALPASDRLAGRLAVTLVSGSDGGCPAPDG